MRAVDLILKKKRGASLSEAEIQYLVRGNVDGSVPDYQMAAFLMAVCFRGMDEAETRFLTTAMMDSGDHVDLAGIEGMTVDKHSTGGVGDKTTLILAPLLASLGLKVAKMSGRGLGHTGGTLDKLEAVPGVRVDLSQEEFVSQVNRTGLAVISQTGNLVPADKKLYALRDVTGTVDEVSLIAGSIMSKKLVIPNDALVLDVKVGSGAFMKSVDDARRLARVMVGIGQGMGRKLSALITEMSQPLGVAIGNALEITESIECLQGKGPADLLELVARLAAELLFLTGKAPDAEKGYQMATSELASGRALEKFAELVHAQGATKDALENLAKAPEVIDVAWEGSSGFVHEIDSEMIGLAACVLGAGREKKEDVIDPAVGVMFHPKIGHPMPRGAVVAQIHASRGKKNVEKAKELLLRSITTGASAVQPQPILHDVVR